MPSNAALQRRRRSTGGGGVPPVALTAEYLVVAGGGGGGNYTGAGGGAGGYRSSVTGESSGGGASAESALNIALGTPYTVTVGAGGAGGTGSATGPLNHGQSGNDSAFSAVSSVGGGGGGTNTTASSANYDGYSGGSGGGASRAGSGGSGTANQGFRGGNQTTWGSAYPAGGGGGAAEQGEDRQGGVHTVGGAGGNGVQSSITGTATYRAGGGGGAVLGSYTPGSGGLGGGGDASAGGTPQSGTTNTGGGGGATGSQSTSTAGAGGSGVVIIRVPSSVVAEFSAGVVYNYIPLDDFNVYEITAAGVSDTVTFSQGAVTTVGESLRFNDDDSAYLSRTPASAGNRKTWTWAGWIKLAGITGARRGLFTCVNSGGNDYTGFEIEPNGLRVYDNNSGGELLTSAVFRDPSAWYHVVLHYNTTHATATERMKLYVNGVRVTSFASVTYPTLNADTRINTTNQHSIGSWSPNTIIFPFDGYMSDVYFIDGKALDPSRFGKQDADGVWQPITYTGTYGTNGFHLDFADNSTAAALGTDVSGNGNNWTPSGITTDDQVTDTPTNNFATINPIGSDSNSFYSEGNLKFLSSASSTSFSRGVSSIPVSSGKWYFEMVGAGDMLVAEADNYLVYSSSVAGSGEYSYGFFNGNKNHDGSSVAYGLAFSSTDVIGCALDLDAGSITFYKNNVSQGVAFTGLTATSYVVGSLQRASRTTNFNFGADSSFAGIKTRQGNPDANGIGDFYYAPPSGYLALCTANLPAPVIADGKEHFQPVLYTGNGTTQAIGGLEFQPDFVWIKNRSATDNHKLLDAVRGATLELESNTTDAEVTNSDGLTAFNSNGFTVGADLEYNTSGENFVAWTWNAGGSTVANTDGTITSQVRANTDAGFSIVSYTGTGSTGTIGHGLTQAPQVIIIKGRDTAFNWIVNTETTGASNSLQLNTTIASTATGAWNNTAPTSSVFTQAGGAATGGSGNTYIAYCFTGVDGFSKFGSYTGNGSTGGPFVYTGFRPAFVMVKASSVSGEQWAIMDSKRLGYNVINNFLNANRNVAELSYGGGGADILSNGFKLRSSSTGLNGSGITFIYMAFAENPFKTARAR